MKRRSFFGVALGALGALLGFRPKPKLTVRLDGAIIANAIAKGSKRCQR